MKILRALRGTLIVLGISVFTAACPGKESHPLTAGHSVTLTWQATPQAKYYCIYRSGISKSSYQKIGTSPTPNYKDAPVPSGATFYYVVTAVDERGESKFSGEITAHVP